MISILVAFYNSSKYIRTCLDSLLNQTNADIEIVCIDDASTDSSAEIVGEYCKRDCRVKLVKLSHNQGIAVARNEGLKHCNGDIITFLDSDDWLAVDSLSIIKDEFDSNPSADCVLFKCINVYEDGHEELYPGVDFKTLSGFEAFKHSLTWSIHGIYAARRKLYDRYQYDISCRIYSDENPTRLHYLISDQVCQSNAPYYYLQHSGSVTHRPSVDRMLRMKAALSMRNSLEKEKVDEGIMRIWETERVKILVDCYFHYFTYRHFFSKDEQLKCLDMLKEGWQSVDFSKANPPAGRRLGYLGLKRFGFNCWRLQEELYFMLRSFIR